MTKRSQQKISLASRLVGTWELVSREDRTASGERRVDPSLGADPLGLLVYDRGGHFAAQFMKRDRSAAFDEPTTRAGANNSRARGGYDAYFGTYVVNEDAGTVTQRLLAALSPENVGHTLTRATEVDGDLLTIRLATTDADGEAVTRILRWRRVA
jgi:hypothetical protein